MIDLWGQSVVYVALINFPTFMLLYYLASDLIVMLYSVNYLESARVFRGFLFLLFMNLTSMGGMVRVIGKTKIVTYLSFITVGVNIVLGVRLVRAYGTMGPVIATIVAGCVGFVYVLWNIKKELDVPIGRLWPWGKLGRLLLASIVASSVFLLNAFFPIHGRLIRILMNSIVF